MKVRLLKGWCNYREGEIHDIDPETAAWLVNTGIGATVAAPVTDDNHEPAIETAMVSPAVEAAVKPRARARK